MKLLLATALLVLVPVQWENVCVSGLDLDSVQCREEERSALLHIYSSLSFAIHSLDGKCHQWKSKWLEGKEYCQWETVTCDPTTGHITQLDLSVEFDPLNDYDPPDCWVSLNASMFLPLRQLRSLSLSGLGIYNYTDGAGVKTWSSLTKLEILDLSSYSLDSSIIYDLASVSSLRALILRFNDIGINLPINGFESWSNLTKLQMLDLSLNVLRPCIFSSTKVSSLRALYLDLNYLNSNINVPIKELSALNLEVLSLRYCGLSGSLPYLGHWSSLKAISLADNDLNDTLTSVGLCQLKNLEELDLSINRFTGNLPSCMGNLSSLKLVDLSANHFQVKFSSSIFKRPVSPRYLYLSGNQLEGTLSMRSFLNHSNLEVLGLSTLESLNFQIEVMNMPFQFQVLELANCILHVEPTFLYSQHKLQVLDLSNTSSTCPLSILWLLENNMNLTLLDLHKNNFTGSLQLPLLTHEKHSILDISENHFDGELPADISINLPNLMFLDLSKNYFHGPLPLISINSLYVLDLSFNFLADDIHKSFPSILSSSFSCMDLSNNQFYGSITNHLNFTRPSHLLLLNDNNISGEIPLNIWNTSLTVLDISNNKLNGVIPYCIGRTEISVLKLSGNYLEGSLPLEMCAVGALMWLDLSDNKFSGSIPPCSNKSSLEIVDLSQNYLTGNFPITWMNISNIYAINIGENHLSGKISIWIGKESSLRMLQARENLLDGSIPKQICQLKYLRIIDLSHNNLYGEIPSCIIDSGLAGRKVPYILVAARRYDTTSLELHIMDVNFLLHIRYIVGSHGKKSMNFGLKLMPKGWLDFYLKGILLIQSTIDLSSNRLVGNIPENIGQMNWLITLNLSNNHLSGTIPNSISILQQLESLDLSHNSLTGEIPREMTKLTSLEAFSVGYNDLSSPTLGVEAQFISFDNSSYEGNPNLCGSPLSKSCCPTLGTTYHFPNEMSDDQRYDDTSFLILFGSFFLFFVVSFLCCMVVLYFKRNWRYALFTLVD